MSVPLPPVLVVDDEKNMRLSLKTVLSDEGYPVRAVESAEEALSLLAHEEVFMVITDARLGGVSGYEFLARAREKWPDLPVLMITAYATPKLAVEAIKAGAMIMSPSRSPRRNSSTPSRVVRSATISLRENANLRARASETFSLEQIVGDNQKAFGWALVLVTTFVINHFDLFGLRQTWRHFRGQPQAPLSFVTPLLYRILRHPLYVGWLLTFWCTPTMTVTHLLSAAVTTVYILVAFSSRTGT